MGAYLGDWRAINGEFGIRMWLLSILPLVRDKVFSRRGVSRINDLLDGNRPQGIFSVLLHIFSGLQIMQRFVAYLVASWTILTSLL